MRNIFTVLEQPLSIKKGMRSDFKRLVFCCACFECAKSGECDPKSCYPEMYAFLYPRGGFSGMSQIAVMRREILKRSGYLKSQRKEVKTRDKKEGSAVR